MLRDPLVDRVLARIGIPPPAATRSGAEALFAAWCLHISFDNVLKRIALAADEPLPGLTSASFFEDFLATGAGGTCWATSGALYDLYRTLGFSTRRAAAAMRANLEGPMPSTAGHGSVIVDVDGEQLLADASILGGTLLPLLPGTATHAGNALVPLTAEPATDRDGRKLWNVRFRSGHVDTPFFCQLLALDVDGAFFRVRHEASRAESGFNARLMARQNHAHSINVLKAGVRSVRTLAGVASSPLAPHDVAMALVHDIGIERSVAVRNPPDTPGP